MMMVLILCLALQDVDRWVRELADDDPAVREAATERLEAAGQDALESVRRAAASPDVEVALRAKGLVATIEVRGRLERGGVRRTTLGRLPGLGGRIMHGADSVMFHVLEDLRKIDGLQIHEFDLILAEMLRGVGDRRWDQATRDFARVAIEDTWRSGSAHRIEVTRLALRSIDPEARSRAQNFAAFDPTFCGRVLETEIFDARLRDGLIREQTYENSRNLVRCLRHPDPELRTLAAKAGYWVAGGLKSLFDARLRTLLKDPDPGVRLEAALVLLEKEASALPVAAESLDRLDAERYRSTLRTLSDQSWDLAVAHVRRKSASGDRAGLQRALEALGGRRFPAEDVREWVKAPEAGIRAAAVHIADVKAPLVRAEVRKLLRDPAPEVRAAVVGSAVDFDDAVLIGLLDDPDEEVRVAAAWRVPWARIPAKTWSAKGPVRAALLQRAGQEGAQEALPGAIEAIDSGDEKCLSNAIYLVGNVGTKEHLLLLLPLLEQEAWRDEAAVTLRARNAEEAVKALKEMVADGRQVEFGVRALVEWNGGRAQEALRELMEGEGNIGRQVAEAFGDNVGSEWVPTTVLVRHRMYRQLLERGSWEAVELVRGVLQKGEVPEEDGWTAIECLSRDRDCGWLLDYVDHGNPEIRVGVIQALSRYPSVRKAVEGVREALDDPEPKVRCTAIDGIRECYETGPNEKLLALAGDEDPSVRRAAVRALAKFKVPEAVAILRRHLDDPDLFDVVSWALAELGDLESLERLRKDERWRRMVLQWNLFHLDPGIPLEGWVKSLAGSAKPADRVRAAELIGERRLVACADVARNLLLDVDRMTRVAAVGALEALGELDPLKARLADPSPLVRLAVIQAVSDLGGWVRGDLEGVAASDPDTQVRMAAKQALEALKPR